MNWVLVAYLLGQLLGLVLLVSLLIYIISRWDKTSWAFRVSRFLFRFSAGIALATLLAVAVYGFFSGWFTVAP